MAKKETNFPPVKVAILIDGGFFIKRFNAQYNKDKRKSGEEVAELLYTMAMKHVGGKNTLYRIFYYDCFPLDKKSHNPVTKKAIDFSKTPEYKFKMELVNALKKKRKVALRMGTLKDNHNWMIRPSSVKGLLSGTIHRMARVARQEDNREVDGRDQEDYKIALPYSRIKILKAPV